MAWTESQFNQGLGTHIRLARKSRELDQARLAEMVGISRSSIVNIEAGKQGVSAYALVRIAGVLGLKVTDLLPREAGIAELFDAVSTSTDGGQDADSFARRIRDIVSRIGTEQRKHGG